MKFINRTSIENTNGIPTIYNDGKCKHNSFEAELFLDIDVLNSSVSIRIAGYGATEQEAIEEFNENIQKLEFEVTSKFLSLK